MLFCGGSVDYPKFSGNCPRLLVSLDGKLAGPLAIPDARNHTKSPKGNLSRLIMIKHLILALVLGAAAVCCSASSVYADSVTLTGGTVSTLGGVSSVSLTGQNFSITYSGEIPQGMVTSFGFNTSTSSFGSPLVISNGVSSTFFKGSLSFDNSTVSGSLLAYGSLQDLFLNQNPLFNVTFSGTGYMTLSDVSGITQTQFSVGSPSAVPEPSTLVLLLTGGLGLVPLKYRRRFRNRRE